MANYLVIVESPAKVKTIKKFLGPNYQVVASNGHVRDLPRSSMGIDTEHDFEPKYITIRGKGEIVAALRKEVKKADKVYLATDPDREGEAISWHLYHTLKLQDKPTYRITFNEITKAAVKESLKNPREIDMNLVDAQQARRILDRIVGYRISPVLWTKIKRGLSAGRVQSVALRMICDREHEIDEFIPEEYWTLDATLGINGEKKPLVASYYGTRDGKVKLTSEEQTKAVMDSLKGKTFAVEEVKVGQRSRKAPLPFTTSTLQQEASKVLNFTTKKTMQLAQQLYEGVDIKGEGTVGLITYLRTDSTRVSDEAQAMAEAFIGKQYGENYLMEKSGEKKETQRIQDAHEAIRPTDLNRLPSAVKDQLPRDLYRLYQLIWKRFLASRMAPAQYETTHVRIGAGDQQFTVAASRIIFDGYMSVYTSDEDEKETNKLSSALEKGLELSFEGFNPEQHFTQPPAHFTEATLVRAMEEQGIGRPSTYAPTISTIQERHYIAKEKRNLFVTELGEAVNEMMVGAFPEVVDLGFTANLETLLDGVEEGNYKWKSIVENFYPDFDEAVARAEAELEKVKVEDEVTDIICEKCGRNMVIKYGRNGKFLACPGYPECTNTMSIIVKTGTSCPKCGSDVVIRTSKKGRRYYSCNAYPECDFISWALPAGKNCPKCGAYMVVKSNHISCSNEQCGYSENKPE